MAEVKIELIVDTETGSGRISAFKKLTESSMQQIQAAGAGAASKIEDAFARLGIRSTRAVEEERKAIVAAYKDILRNGVATEAEIGRARAAFKAKTLALNAEIGRSTERTTKQVEAAWSKTWRGLVQMWGWAKASWAGLAASLGTLSIAWQWAEMAASFQQTEQAFQGMVQQMGVNGDALMKKLTEVSGGIIDKKSLQEAANRAISLGIPIEKLSDLMAIARVKAREMGITTTQAFNDIVTGVGRGSPMIIDNLGISLKLGEAYETLARRLGKTSDQLTPVEQKMAILNATLEAGKESVDRNNLAILTQAEQLQRVRTEWENFKIGAGTLVLRLQGLILGLWNAGKLAANGLALAFYGMVLPLAWLTDKVHISQGAFEELKGRMAAMGDEAIRNQGAMVDAFASVIASDEAYAATVRTTNRDLGDQSEATDTAGEALKKYNDLLKEVEKNQAKWNAELLGKKDHPIVAKTKFMVDFPQGDILSPQDRERMRPQLGFDDAMEQRHQQSKAWIGEEIGLMQTLNGLHGEENRQKLIAIGRNDTLFAIKQNMASALTQEILGQQAYGKALKNATAEALAAVAARMAVEAIFMTGIGLAALTPWGAAIYGPAPLWFKAAAQMGAGAVAAGAMARALYNPPSEKGKKAQEDNNPPPEKKTSSSTPAPQPQQIINYYFQGDLVTYDDLARKLRPHQQELARDTV